MSKIIGNPVGTTLPKPDWNQTDPNKGDYIKNKPDVEALKTLVGDTSVADQINTAVANLLDNSTEAVDSIYELRDAMEDNADAITALEEIAGKKANASDLTSHTSNKNNPHEVGLSQLGVTATAAELNIMDGVTATTTELNYVDGVTSNIQTQLNAKVPTSRTVNGKALTGNITLSASDVGADASGSASSALTSAKSYTDAEITEWVGDKTVASQISTAVSTKANTSDLTSHTGNTTVHITSTERTNWNAAKTHADSAHAPSNAEANQNAFSNIAVGSTTIAADSKTDTLTLVGSNVTITPDTTNDKVTIGITKDNVTTALGYTPPTSDTNTTYTFATGDNNGQIKVTPSDGSAQNISVQGLGSAAYTASTAYDAAGAANTALSSAKSYTDGEITEWVGDKTVATQIGDAIDEITPSSIGAAAESHNHTKSQITDFPASLKNPNALTIQGNGTTLTNGTYDGSAAKTVNITPASIGAATTDHTHNYIPTSEKGAASGVATLDTTGKVPSSQLPSYVDDVVEGYYLSSKFYKTNSTSGTVITGETGKIYVDLATNKTYRWSGSAYVVISETLALGETSSTAYAGDKGKALESKVGDTPVVDQISDAIEEHTHTVSHTPAGSVSSSFSGTAASHDHGFTGSAVTSGEASDKTTVYSITAVGTLPSHTYTAPSLTASCANQCLTLTFSAGSHDFSAGTLPTKGTGVSVATGAHTHSVTAAGTVGSKSITPAGSVTSTFTGTNADLTTSGGK